MQSTSNTALAPPIRPKIGRPPAAFSAPPPVMEEEMLPVDEAETESGVKTPPHRRFDAKLLMISLAIVLAVTLVLSHVITPALTNVIPTSAPPIPPLAVIPVTPAVPGQPPVSVAGALAPIGPAEPAVSYTPEEPKAPIDNDDRQRLRSIISKD